MERGGEKRGGNVKEDCESEGVQVEERGEEKIHQKRRKQKRQWAIRGSRARGNKP